MVWNAYFVKFYIKSPVHIGYNKDLEFERTRFYIPAKNIQGAVANSLAEESGMHLSEINENFGNSLLFSTFFISDDGENALYPSLTPEGSLAFGKDGISAWDFANQYISSKETVRYDLPYKSSKMNFILPYNNITQNQNYAVGYVFANSENTKESGLKGWLRSLKRLNVGEEIMHGLGSIQLKGMTRISQGESWEGMFSIKGIKVDMNIEGIQIKYFRPNPLLAHTLIEGGYKEITKIYGVREKTRGKTVLVGTDAHLEESDVYWVPGTLVYPVEEGASFQLGSSGVWYLNKNA